MGRMINTITSNGVEKSIALLLPGFGVPEGI